MNGAPAQPRPVPTWGAPAPARVGSSRCAMMGGVLALVVASIVGLAWFLGGPVPTAIVIAFFIADAALVPVIAAGYVRGRVRTRVFAPDESPRLANIVAGLASDLGMPTPELLAVEDVEGVNALVLRTPRPAIAVTRALVDELTLTELEAVVAHCLVRHRSAPLAHGRSWARQLLRPCAARVGWEDDIHAAALTRYPPALASALRKATPQTTLSSLWFVADGPAHRPAEERAAAIEDL